jgi:site-specific recombinase XerD
MAGTRRNPGAMGPFVDGYREWLGDRGYSSTSVIKALIALGHLGRWLDEQAIAVEHVDRAVIDEFVAAQPRNRAGRLPFASVAPLIIYLRARGVVPAEPDGPTTPMDDLLVGYRSWLEVDRGLAPDTVRGHVEIASRFLSSVGSEHGAVVPVGGEHVMAFLLSECERVTAASAGVAAHRLRSLVRYLAGCGLADPGLVAAVPRVARWRGARLPQFPPSIDIDRLLSSVDRSTLVGARDHAILLLLARLGLRAVEVSRIQLDDLDWRRGELTVDGKGHQRDRLPLPDDVGAALVTYLVRRGACDTRRVFLTPRAPIRPIEAAGVRTVVRRAHQRAGLRPVPAHQLRHALASSLVREGASLIAIGQVLRHRHLESTRIYAKVDLERLRLAARPWPETAR